MKPKFSPMRFWTSRLVCLSVVVSLLAPLGAAPESPAEAKATIQEIGTLVERHFFDPKLGGLDWATLVDETAQSAQLHPEQIEEQANRLLGRLRASHTRFFPVDSQGFHELCGVFAGLGHFPEYQKRSAYRGVGWFLMSTPQGTFIKNLWPGFPAEKAGLMVGDQILDLELGPPTSLQQFQKKKVHLRYKRRPEGPVHELILEPQNIEPLEAFEEAQRRSVRVEKRPGAKIGYLAIRCYAGDRFYELLEEQLAAAPLKDCDALVVDIRDGWGGASPKFLDIFQPHRPFLQLIDRQGRQTTFGAAWRKPVAFLINGGTTSGKEVLAYGLQTNRWGLLVGERTAGALLAGRAYLLQGERGLLYLAVADAKVNGQRLEGIGVQPDLPIARTIPFCQGVDPQLQAAVEALVSKVTASKSPP